MKCLGFTTVLLSFCAIAACSASSSKDGTNSSGGDGGKDASSATGDAGGSSGEGGGEEQLSCELQESDACLDCCTSEHSVGSDALDVLFYTYCGCDTGAACADLCDTLDDATNLCVGVEEFNFAIDNKKCTDCLQEVVDEGTDECLLDVQKDCKKTDDCIAFGSCQLKCPAAE